MDTPLSQCHASLGATQYSAACQTHLRCTLNWTAAGRDAEKERGRMEDGREGVREQGEFGREVGTRGREGGRSEGARGGREEAMMIGSERDRESVSGGREGRGREGC